MAVPNPWRLILVALLSIAVAGCGGDDDASSSSDAAADDGGPAEAEAEDTSADEDAGDDSGDDDASTDDDAGDDASESADLGAAGGTLVLGDETIALDSARCFLEEQDAAGGGGKILFVGQGFGTNAAGEAVAVDVSRFDEDSQFTGDDIIIDIGEPGESVSWNVTADLGTVQINGNVMSADGLTFSNFELQSDLPGSFELNC